MRIILLFIYTFITLIGLVGNTMIFYALCIDADRLNLINIHVLIWNLLVEGTIWTTITYIAKIILYVDLDDNLASTNGIWLNDTWCKSEMYILRTMDFVLAYTIVCLCFDRCVKRKMLCYRQCHFISGICILLSLWLVVCYALIPILFFNQQLKQLTDGLYECVYNETQINQLSWLSSHYIQTPYRTIHLIDFLFGNVLPILLMISLLLLPCFLGEKVKQKQKQHSMNYNYNSSDMDTDTYTKLNIIEYDDDGEHPNLTKMVVLYVVVYICCQLPYYIYRLVRIYNPSIESNLNSMNILHKFDITLSIFRLVNRSINPWLSFYLIHSMQGSSRRSYFSFWCCHYFPCYPNRWLSLRNLLLYIRHKWYNLTTGPQIIREIRPTGYTIKREFIDSKGKCIRQTYEEYVRYYHRPCSHFTDVNPALLFAERHTPSVSDYSHSLTSGHKLQLDEPLTKL